MRRLALLSSLAVTACTAWPAVDPNGNQRLSDDPRLGTKVFDSAPLKRVQARSGGAGAHRYLYVYETNGHSTDLVYTQDDAIQLFELDASNALTPLPLPPFTQKLFDFQPVAADHGLYATGGVGEGAFFDGTQWTKLPKFPGNGFAITEARSATEVIGFNNLTAFAELWALHGSTWDKLDVGNGSQVGLGPWDANGLILITTAGSKLCATRYLYATLAPQGPPICLDNGDSRWLLGNALNGTTADFQVLRPHGIGVGDPTATVFHFSGGAWTRGDDVRAIDLQPAPGALEVVGAPVLGADGNGLSIPSVVRLKEGKQLGVIPPWGTTVSCGCDRNADAKCDCLVRGTDTHVRYSDDAKSVTLVTVSSADARKAVYVQKLELPPPPDPFGAPANCMCPPMAHCIATGDGAPDCELDLTQFDGGAPPALPRITATFVPADPASTPWTLTVTGADGGVASTFRIVSPLPALDLEVSPHGQYQITAALPNHTPASFLVPAADLTQTTALGSIGLVRAPLLGVAAEPFDRNVLPLTATRPGEWVLRLLDADGAVRWRAVRPGDGGFRVTVLADAPLVATKSAVPRFSPDGAFLFLETPTGLSLLDATTDAVLGTIADPELSLDLADFAASAARVAIVKTTGATLVAAYGPSGLQPVATVSAANTPFTVDHLDADGTRLLREENGISKVYDLPALTSHALPPFLTKVQLASDGTRAFGLQKNPGVAQTWALLEVPLSPFGATNTISAITGASYAVGRSQPGLAFNALPPDGGFTGAPSRYDWTTGMTSALTVPPGAFTSAPSAQGGEVLFLEGSSTNASYGWAAGTGALLADKVPVPWHCAPRGDGRLQVSDPCTSGTACDLWIYPLDYSAPQKLIGGQGRFGAANERALRGTTLAAVDPSSGQPSSTVPLVSAIDPLNPDPHLLGPLRTFDLDALGAPCALFTVPLAAFTYATDGVASPADAGLGLYCAQ